MTAMIRVAALLGLALVLGCSDDTTAPPAGDGTSGTGDKQVVIGEGQLPWPDRTIQLDTAAGSCTAGATGMCDDNKNYFCNAGACTACPAGRKDCDRKDNCECEGACDGVKCVKPGG